MLPYFVISIHLILIFAFQFIPAVLKPLNNNPPCFPHFPARTIQAEPEAAALEGHSEQTLTLKYLFKVKTHFHLDLKVRNPHLTKLSKQDKLCEN